MEARKVIGIICAIYAVLMTIIVLLGFLRPTDNLLLKQIGGILGVIVSATVSWYMLKEEKVVPLDDSPSA
jgi:succinate-acetate transporter protein